MKSLTAGRRSAAAEIAAPNWIVVETMKFDSVGTPQHSQKLTQRRRLSGRLGTTMQGAAHIGCDKTHFPLA